jgi:FKBP-type peptidyl-prolyl cis-trans isomerase SlyD
MKSPMTITEQCVVALTWTLKDTLGEELDVLDEPVEFLVGGTTCWPRSRKPCKATRPAPPWTCTWSRKTPLATTTTPCCFWSLATCFPLIEEGMGFEGLPAGCNPNAPKDRLYFVSDIYPEHVVLDANHPLAGIALRISMKVHAVREAEENEVGAGSLGTGFFSMQVNPARATTPDDPRPHCTEPRPMHQKKGLLTEPFFFGAVVPQPDRWSRSPLHRARWPREFVTRLNRPAPPAR